MIDYYRRPDALDLNMKLEFKRNNERYEFMKWGMQAFDTFKVVPPGIGIVHQVNLEYLARGVHKKDGVYYPDTLVGTDSHTTMINGIGVVGWGVGGIEAEAGMLGQPVYFLTPDVVGVEVKGKLGEGITATDLVLTVTEMLRKEKVVGKFVEFFGEGTASLSVPDRATIANMAPEYGATMGFFPVDEATVDYLTTTGRTAEEIDAFASYFKAQGLFGIPRAGEIDYTKVLTLDLATIKPSLAGPKRPQDRIAMGEPQVGVRALYSAPVAENGFGQPAEKLGKRYPTRERQVGRGQDLRQQHGAARERAAARRRRDGRQPADAGHGRATRAEAARHRQRRRADRRDHVVHEHVESGRAARRGAAREEGGREGPDGQAAHQDFARARLARRHRLSGQGRTPARISSSSVSASRPTAARRASATRATSRRRSTRRSTRTTWSAPRCSRATATSRRESIRTSRRTSSRRRRSSSPSRSRARCCSDLTTEPLGTGKDGPVFLKDIWPSSHEIAAVMSFAQGSGDLPQALRRPRQRESAVEGRLPARRARSTGGRTRPTSRSRRSSTASR